MTRQAPGVIWATRGRRWGFRLLLTAGLGDPLACYELAFEGAGDELMVCRRTSVGIALRFPDPEARMDESGRVIPHEFVVTGVLANDVHTVGDGLKLIWPMVKGVYDRVWDAASPPTDLFGA